MSSFSSSLYPILIIILSLLLVFISPSCSLPRPLFQSKTPAATGLRLSLLRRDLGNNLTKLERIQHGIKRSELRLQKFNTETSPSDLRTPVYPGSGEFLMNMSIGTPPKPYYAILDTGSDLIWTQCQPSQNCFSQPTPIFNPKKSSSFKKLPCSSKLCDALPSPSCGDGCEYQYRYGDQSSTSGSMGTETFTFESGSVSNIGFGCGVDNDGGGFVQGAGLVGLGRGPLSLVSQLEEPKFSYCLTSIDSNKPSTLLMGSLVKPPSSPRSKIKTTPLIQSPAQPTFYYLSLEGISVGGTRLSIDNSSFALGDDGSGGFIIDSGTTITYLEPSAYDVVKEAFISKIKLPVSENPPRGLDLCFQLLDDTIKFKVPTLVFHFQGADLELPSENYIIADSSSGLMCLAMVSSTLGISIFGNIQQQNMLVLHDLTKETLSFVPTKC